MATEDEVANIVIDLGGYNFLTTLDDALNAARFVARATRIERDWNAPSGTVRWKPRSNSDEVCVQLTALTHTQLAELALKENT